MSESNFQRRCLRALKREWPASHAQKMRGEGANGVPDYYVEFGHRRVAWVEFKVGDNKPSKLQEIWIKRSNQKGAPAWVVTQKDEEIHVDDLCGTSITVDSIPTAWAVMSSSRNW